MQLCKCLNCFLKTHNKQLNQYYLNFIIFFYQKKVLKNALGLSRVTVWITGQTVFISSKKNQVRVKFFRVKFWPVLLCLVSIPASQSSVFFSWLLGFFYFSFSSALFSFGVESCLLHLNIVFLFYFILILGSSALFRNWKKEQE